MRDGSSSFTSHTSGTKPTSCTWTARLIIDRRLAAPDIIIIVYRKGLQHRCINKTILILYFTLFTLGCRYQYFQEPLTELYCDDTNQQTVPIGCGVVYPEDDPRVNLVFFDGDNQISQANQCINNVQHRQINSTHRISTCTIRVPLSTSPTQYHCFPQFSNNSLLLPSQALDTSTSSQLLSCLSVSDIYSTYTTRCADLDYSQQMPDDPAAASSMPIHVGRHHLIHYDHHNYKHDSNYRYIIHCNH